MPKRKFWSFLNLPVGLVPTFVVTGLLFGDFEAAQFVFLCPITAIVAWPSAFILGFLIMKLGAFSGPKPRKVSEIPELTREGFLRGVAMARTASSKSAALKDYLQQATAKGIERSAMVSILIKCGWSESEIDDALGEISVVGEF